MSTRQHPRRLTRALAVLRPHPWFTSMGLLAYAVAVILPHENVQWVMNQIAIRIGHANLYRLAGGIALLLAAVLSAAVIRSADTARTELCGLWCMTLFLIAAAWAGLTANNLELVHYPQYFPEGAVLLALTLSPAEALSWVMLFGGLDEGFQYWLLPRTRVSLFDFNDLYMDLLGGAAGVVFAMAFLTCSREEPERHWRKAWKKPGSLTIVGVTGAGVLLWALGLMLVVRDPTNTRYWFALGDFRAPSFWAHVVENGPKHYHTLAPVEGTILIYATIAVYTVLTRKLVLYTGIRGRSTAQAAGGVRAGG